MKNKILTLLKRFGKAFWGSLSHNLGLKLLSLLLAILLWSYVVSSNPSITLSLIHISIFWRRTLYARGEPRFSP